MHPPWRDRRRFIEQYYFTMRGRSASRIPRGFSMVEMVIAFAIFIFAAATILLGFTAIFHLNANSRSMVLATTLAQQEMETLIAQDQFVVAPASDNPSELPGSTRTWSGGSIGYNCATPPVEETFNGTELSDQCITVTVTWTEKGRNRSVKLQSLLSQ